ncbi:MAG: MiaB/RimO family radical SAM methylthiotransferase [Spirochaetes bacterium]|nr:MiaB/RimO family radical SAM methylthiotransferase [Spirochaetota bacterium]
MTFHLVHLGCKVNAAEMETLSRDLLRCGWAAGPLEGADVAVVNTCTVTQRADSKSLYAIRRTAARAKRVFVTGCFSELEREAALSIPGVAAIIPQSEKANAAALIRASFGAVEKVHDYPGDEALHEPSPHPWDREATEGSSHARVILKIQDGCNAFCAYCRIPHARGLPKSVPSRDLLSRVRELSGSGVTECVLTGINLGLWRENGSGLEDLLGWILEASGPMYIRLSSLEPRSFEKSVSRHFDHPRLVPHLHFPLQGGSDSLLARMNRRYTTAAYRDFLAAMRERKPDLSVSTDVIVGFPGETEAEFEESLAFYAACGFSKVHVFPFSPRPKTAAQAMPGRLDAKLLTARGDRLKAAAARWEEAYLRSTVGQVQRFVLETEPIGGFAEGTTDRYLKGRIPVASAGGLKRGDSAWVRVPAEGDLFEPVTKGA